MTTREIIIGDIDVISLPHLPLLLRFLSCDIKKRDVLLSGDRNARLVDPTSRKLSQI